MTAANAYARASSVAYDVPASNAGQARPGGSAWPSGRPGGSEALPRAGQPCRADVAGAGRADSRSHRTECHSPRDRDRGHAHDFDAGRDCPRRDCPRYDAARDAHGDGARGDAHSGHARRAAAADDHASAGRRFDRGVDAAAGSSAPSRPDRGHDDRFDTSPGGFRRPCGGARRRCGGARRRCDGVKV
jgi:hypothetical protein